MNFIFVKTVQKYRKKSGTSTKRDSFVD